MATETTTETSVFCPSCGGKGTSVKPLTLRALLREECVDLVGDEPYRFCDRKDCNVVYYRDGQTFTKAHLKAPVGVKETSGERPLCYCFGHSVASIKQELRTKGRSDALEDIRAKMKDPGCRCETENPSGACCLGTVAKGIETAQAEVRMPSGSKAETITKVGTILSAIMASACCWLPLLLLAVGVSGVGVATTLEMYRPLFIIVTFGFLAAAFCFTYRPRRTSSADAYCTATQSCCPPSGTAKPRRLNMLAFNKVMLWVVTVLAVAFLLIPHYVGLFLAEQTVISAKNQKPSALTRQTVVAIEGMHCEGCAMVAEQSLEEVPGVLDATIDYDKKQAIVVTEACRPFPKEEVLTAVKKAGYRGKIIKVE